MSNKKKHSSHFEKIFKKYYKKELLRSNKEVSTHLLMLKLISSNPNLTQRQLSKDLGISLGKTNYVLNSFIDKGLIKLENFRRSNNKISYRYLLTKAGINEKLELTQSYLIIKIAEYDRIQNEIKDLNNEVESLEESRN